MSQLPSDIASLLIPMQGRPWLVPNIVVAEVIPLRQPDRPGHGPEWLLGWLNWRDQDLPLLSFEKLNESGQVTIGEDARIAVLNTVTGKTPFYAVIVQGIPRLLRVSKNDPVEEPVDTGPAEAMYIQVGGDLAVIPDLDAIEGAVTGLKAPA
ncbi:chemotaxis protein [Alcanivorax hongdengensis A-11-3]|uniref:Chemotaxis protein n=1 Tax=Alcanivorax hongdengensis A-11-3 TaxID=1177179 RepID=L0W7S8_9GAMM|nr:chemotaxis protein CheW [Alcanivorax hongdengensis]EKF72946.1 chemotaxis protein [Alcanivorax hongdengensis A-11-3]